MHIRSYVSQFWTYETRAIQSQKVVRLIRLTLYGALGARRVDLVGSGDLEAKCEGSEGRSSTDSESGL